MLSYASVLRLVAAGLVISLAMICGITAGAQSGRRAKPTAPVSVPTPEPTPTPTAPPEKLKPAFTFIVGIEKYGNFSSISLDAYSGVLRTCTKRLNDSPAAAAQSATRDMTRADAIRNAKNEKEAYTVWLQLRNAMSGNQDNNDSSNVDVQYSVFAPITAKQVTSGTIFPDAYRNKQIRLPTPTTSGDYALNQAARGAAERILDHFHLGMMTTHP